jgi:23S rRNA (guanosine2251-2'-O)-methyltransferase
VRELLLVGRRKVHEVWLASDLDPAPILDEIRELASEDRVPIREVSRSKLDAEARTDAPQGVLAHAADLHPVDLDGLTRPAAAGRPEPFLLALDGITDPGNLGALLRSAECAGVTGVILPRHRSAHVTAAVTKAAAGAVEHLQMALVSGIPTALTQLKDLGVWSVGLDAGADRTVWELDVATDPVVLVLGAEGKGLSRLVRERCDQLAGIPLAGRLESLNVATAGAIACYEVVRRRQEG